MKPFESGTNFDRRKHSGTCRLLPRNRQVLAALDGGLCSGRVKSEDRVPAASQAPVPDQGVGLEAECSR